MTGHGLSSWCSPSPPALGHLYHFVLIVNMGQRPGFPRVADGSGPLPTRVAGLWISSAFLLWNARSGPMVELVVAVLRLRAFCAWSPALVLPLTSSRIAWRRRPTESTGTSQTLDLTQPEGTAALDRPGPACTRCYGFRATNRFGFACAMGTSRSRTSGAARSACSIVQITDLHFAPCFERRYFEMVVDACRDWRADLVVITGDIVEHDDVIAWIEPLLGPPRPGLGNSRSWATTTSHINRG